MEKEYTDLLRVPLSVVKYPDMRDYFLAYIDRNRGFVQQIIFFVHGTHDVRTIEEMNNVAEQLKPVIATLNAWGYETGINVLCTVGHHVEIPDPGMDHMDFQEYIDGEKSRGRLCAQSEQTLQYIAEMVRIFARLDISILYADDDLDYGVRDCCCPRCLAQFEENYGLFAKHGLSVDKSSFRQLYISLDREIRRITRLNWQEFNVFRLKRILNVIQSAARSVNPSIRLGYMSCVSEGRWVKDFAEILGNGGSCFWRPGGGLYTDFTPLAAMQKAHNIARQIRFLPESVQAIQSEIENFPFQSLKKSAAFVKFESALYLFAGCTGTAFDILPWNHTGLREFEQLLNAIPQLRSFAEYAQEALGNSKPMGVGNFVSREMYLDLQREYMGAPSFITELFNVGIPPAYENDKIGVFFVDESTAAAVTDAEITEILSKGAFLSAQALKIINERGFSEYTGFRAVQEYRCGVKERDLTHPLVAEGNYVRNACLEFSLNRHSEFELTDPAFEIERTAETAEYLTELVDYAENHVGFASGIFQNKLGGRVAVSGYAPFQWCYSEPRTVQLKNLLCWLSQNSLPAYAASCARVAVWCRGYGEDTRLGIANLSWEPMNNLEIAVKQGPKKLLLMTNSADNGQWTELCKLRQSGDYAIYSIPHLDVFGVGVLKADLD